MTKDSTDTKYEEIEDTGTPEFRKSNPNPRKNGEENATMDPVKDIELIELENTTKSIM